MSVDYGKPILAFENEPKANLVAVVNKLQIEIVGLTKKYDNLYRQTKKIEHLLDDTITPTNTKITYAEIVDNLSGRINDLETANERLEKNCKLLTSSNEIYSKNQIDLKKQIEDSKAEKLTYQKKYKGNIRFAIVLILLLVVAIIILQYSHSG